MITIRDGPLRIWMIKKVWAPEKMDDNNKRWFPENMHDKNRYGPQGVGMINNKRWSPEHMDEKIGVGPKESGWEQKERWSPENMEDKKPTDDLEVSLLLPAACVYSRLALCSCCSQYCLSTNNKNSSLCVLPPGSLQLLQPVLPVHTNKIKPQGSWVLGS